MTNYWLFICKEGIRSRTWFSIKQFFNFIVTIKSFTCTIKALIDAFIKCFTTIATHCSWERSINLASLFSCFIEYSICSFTRWNSSWFINQNSLVFSRNCWYFIWIIWQLVYLLHLEWILRLIQWFRRLLFLLFRLRVLK